MNVMNQAVEDAQIPDVSATRSELDEPIWSVVSFERVEGTLLDHQSAQRLMNELEFKRVPGLCIITNDAAARVKIRE